MVAYGVALPASDGMAGEREVSSCYLLGVQRGERSLQSVRRSFRCFVINYFCAIVRTKIVRTFR